mgnify:CR=1 FL=1
MVKALHIIAMVAWFAGLFYIFRLFVYHRIHFRNPEVRELLSLMEFRLLRYIIRPASIAVPLLGSVLIYWNPALLQEHWLWLKLVLVALLYGYQALSNYTHRAFRKQNFFLSERACRMWNEFPTLILIGAVLLAILKPQL